MTQQLFKKEMGELSSSRGQDFSIRENSQYVSSTKTL